MNEFWFINIIDRDKEKLLLLCKEFEERYDANIVTGISFLHTKDTKYLLCFVFSNHIKHKEALENADKQGFERILTQELNYAELLDMSQDVAFIGNFTYKMIDGVN